MTIATHCLDLLTDHGPLLPEELGRRCQADGVTSARNPTAAVVNAIGVGRTVDLPDGRLASVLWVLEGRWLTTTFPAAPCRVDPGLDLCVLGGPVARDGVPLATGGALCSRGWSDERLTAPEGWLGAVPEDSTLGLRVRSGVVDVAAVTLDSEAHHRGEALAARLLEAAPSVATDYYGQNSETARTLLQLMLADPEVLSEPVPPLSLLLPRLEPPEPDEGRWRYDGLYGYGRGPSEPTCSARGAGDRYRGDRPYDTTTTLLHLPSPLFDQLEVASCSAGLPLEEWLVDQLATWCSWPHAQG